MPNNKSQLLAINTKLYSTYVNRPLKKEPLYLKSLVVKGFGRGGKQLGCPTANLEEHCLTGKEETGIWMGFAKVQGNIYKCVASIGWNPFFQNEKKTCEPHILHKFDKDFYGDEIELVLCGYIRNEANFDSLESLINAIHQDIAIAEKCLDDEEFLQEKKCLEHEEKPKKQRTLFVLEISPETVDVNLEEICSLIKTKISHKGIQNWGAEHKIIPIGFGVCKLAISVVVYDDDIDMDQIEQLILDTVPEDSIQSINVAAMSKV